VWGYFEKDDDPDSTKATCILCGEALRHSNNTSNLFKHLKCKHAKEYEVCEKEKKELEEVECRKKRPVSRQLSLESSVARTSAYPHSSPKWKETTDAVLTMIAQDMQPISVVENEGFRRLLHVMDPRYQLPSCSTITRVLLPQKYEVVKSIVKAELNQTQYMALTTDLWTSNQTVGYIMVTCHFVSEAWELCSRVLDTVNVDKDHTAENLAGELNRIATEWEIGGKISCITTDNASNIVAAANLLRWRHLPCFAHTLNLIVRDSLQADSELVSRLQEKCKEITSAFRRSTKATEKLMSIQRQTHPETQHLRLKQDVETRWNSAYYMIERIADLNEVGMTALCLLGKNHLCLDPSDHAVVVQTISVLKPFEKATREMSGDSFVSVSKLIPLIHLLQDMLGPAAGTSSSTAVESRLQMELKHQMKRRFAQIESNYTLAAPTILDPWFKKVAFCSLEPAERTVQ